MIKLVSRATISRFGDRVKVDTGYVLRRLHSGTYRLTVPKADPLLHVFAKALTPDRVTTIMRGEITWDIYTYGLRDGFDPGSDLDIRIFRESNASEPADGVLLQGRGIGETFDLSSYGEGSEVIVQPHAKTFRMPVVEVEKGSVKITTLITRAPPTPLETNVEIAVIKSLGPIRSSSPGA